MESQDKKLAFIRLRAEGKTYSRIASELQISKSTCSSWERELAESIATCKQEALDELYIAYGMTKEARIKRLGNAIGKITEALNASDLSTVQPEKLLELLLKYSAALNSEYIAPRAELEHNPMNDPDSVIKGLQSLLESVRKGEITAEQATKESVIYDHLLKAYETNELKTKIENLESALGVRQL